MDEIGEVVRLVPQECIPPRTVEQIVHVPVPRIVDGGSVPNHSQERISKRITDSIVDVPAAKQRQALPIQTVKKTLEVPQVQSLIEWQTCLL